MTRLRRFLAGQNGAAAAEFALVIPVAVLLIFAVIHMGLLLYTSTRLHWAVEDAARCASIRSDCHDDDEKPDKAKTEAWAQSRYGGMAPALFVATPAACGNQVVGSANYNFNAVLYNTTIPLTATSCFP